MENFTIIVVFAKLSKLSILDVRCALAMPMLSVLSFTIDQKYTEIEIFITWPVFTDKNISSVNIVLPIFFFIIISVKFAANLLNTFSLICLFLVVLAGPIKSNKFIQSSLLDNLP